MISVLHSFGEVRFWGDFEKPKALDKCDNNYPSSQVSRVLGPSMTVLVLARVNTCIILASYQSVSKKKKPERRGCEVSIICAHVFVLQVEVEV